MTDDDLKDLEQAALKLSDQGRRGSYWCVRSTRLLLMHRAGYADDMVLASRRYDHQLVGILMTDVKTIINGLSERMRKDILAVSPHTPALELTYRRFLRKSHI